MTVGVPSLDSATSRLDLVEPLLPSQTQGIDGALAAVQCAVFFCMCVRCARGLTVGKLMAGRVSTGALPLWLLSGRVER
jgi:hypothetical protein